MGNWHISIEGQGAHHNPDYANDANRLAAEFVAKLREAGHTVTRATFTHGGAEQLGEESQHDVRSHPQRVDTLYAGSGAGVTISPQVAEAVEPEP